MWLAANEMTSCTHSSMPSSSLKLRLSLVCCGLPALSINTSLERSALLTWESAHKYKHAHTHTHHQVTLLLFTNNNKKMFHRRRYKVLLLLWTSTQMLWVASVTRADSQCSHFCCFWISTTWKPKTNKKTWNLSQKWFMIQRTKPSGCVTMLRCVLSTLPSTLCQHYQGHFQLSDGECSRNSVGPWSCDSCLPTAEVSDCIR